MTRTDKALGLAPLTGPRGCFDGHDYLPGVNDGRLIWHTCRRCPAVYAVHAPRPTKASESA